MTSECLNTALAVGFLFASGAAILGDATALELGEGGSTEGTAALQGGFPLGFIQLVQQGRLRKTGLDMQGVTKLFQFGEGQS